MEKTTVHNAVLELERNGCIIDSDGAGINVYFPEGQTVSDDLLTILREEKAEAISFLRYRGFEPVPPSEGDLHVITVDATDNREMLRWHTAIDTGLVALSGKILYRTGDNTALIRYRCSFPPEWLPDAITRAAKEKYNRTLERIENGGKWLQAHGESHPDYARCYEAYQALYENLRKLYVAIGTPLDDPMTGYVEVAQ